MDKSPSPASPPPRPPQPLDGGGAAASAPHSHDKSAPFAANAYDEDAIYEQKSTVEPAVTEETVQSDISGLKISRGFTFSQNLDKNSATKFFSKGVFHEAALHGAYRQVEMILRKCADLREVLMSKDQTGRTAIHGAAYNMEYATLQLLLENPILQEEIDSKDFFGCNALLLAAMRPVATGSIEASEKKRKCIALLLEKGSKPQLACAVKGDGSTIFHWLAQHGLSTCVEEVLRNRGEDAAKAGDFQEFLSLTDSQGRLAIDIAGHEAVSCAVLVEQEKLNRDFTKQKEKISRLNVANLKETLRLLVKNTALADRMEKGCFPNKRTTQSLLTWACFLGEKELVDIILTNASKAGLRLDLAWAKIPEQRGRTCLHFALLGGCTTTASVLLERSRELAKSAREIRQHAAFVNAADQYGTTAVHLSLMLANFPQRFGNDVSSAKLLISKFSGNPSKLDEAGRTATLYAREEMQMWLRQHREDYFMPRHVKDKKSPTYDWVLQFRVTESNYSLVEQYMRRIAEYVESRGLICHSTSLPNRQDKKKFAAGSLLMLTANNSTLRKYAAQTSFPLPVIMQRRRSPCRDGVQHVFEPLMSRQRIELIGKILLEKFDLPVMRGSGMLKDFFPMHEECEKYAIEKIWTHNFIPIFPWRRFSDFLYESEKSSQSGLTRIAAYFGEKKAFYFAFTCTYTVYLVSLPRKQKL